MEPSSLDPEVRRSAFDDAVVGMAIIGLDSNYIEANGSCLEILGYDREEFLEMSVDMITPIENVSVFEDMVARLLEGDSRSVTYEKRLIHKDGHEVPVRITASLIRSEGSPTMVFAQVEDVAELDGLESMVEECNSRMRSMMEILPGMAYHCLDVPSYTNLIVSPGSLELTGHPPEELIDDRVLSFSELIFPEDRERVWNRIQQALDEGERFQLVYRIVHPEKGIRWVWEQGRRIDTTEDGIPVLEGYITDITDARDMEMRFRRLVESSPIGIAEVSVDGTVHESNARFDEMLDAMGRRFGDNLMKVLSRVMEDGHAEDIRRAMAEGETINFDARYMSRHFEVILSPLNADRAQAIVMDVTEVRQAREMESFIASLLRHDLNNRLITISGFASLLSERVSGDDLRMVGSIRHAADDGLRLIEKVRRLSSLDPEGTRSVRLGPMVSSVIDDSRRMLGERDVTITSEGCDIDVMAGPLVEEMLANIVDNAVRHSGCTRVHIDCEVVGDLVRVTVEDDGEGVSPEFMRCFFEQGSRSGPNAGSGHGTYLARRVALGYGGDMMVSRSEIGGLRVETTLRRA